MARTRHRQKNSSSRAKYLQSITRRADKQTINEARARGFRTSKDGVIVDGPRNKKRDPIPGARVTAYRGGVVKIKKGAREDYILGFTRAERERFAKDPAAMEREALARLRARFPNLRRVRKVQSRLQWGAYQATKDFSPTYFTFRYFTTVSPEERKREGRNAKPRLDKLTGFHFVIHVPRKRAKKGKRGKRR